MVELHIRVTGHETQTPVEGSQGERTLIHTDQGDLSCLFHRVAGAETAVLWAGSWWGEGQDRRGSPISQAVAEGLAQDDGIASLLLRYRHFNELGYCVQDTEAGVAFLQSLGIQRIALVGHSFSGAVVISAAPLSQTVVAVVALASQTYGARSASHLSPRPLLLVHGTEDTRLNPYCSEQIYSWARKPKELVLLEGASHSLWERKDDLLPLLRRWLADKLHPIAPTPGQ